MPPSVVIFTKLANSLTCKDYHSIMKSPLQRSYNECCISLWETVEFIGHLGKGKRQSHVHNNVLTKLTLRGHAVARVLHDINYRYIMIDIFCSVSK